mmetsp:Transcript_3219/g.8226  ORF Transcript_3219/g.8226 Transcript_3219/m.8226 type:complete len:215 (+) Transcript_3219:407-1051(+)
MHESIDLSLEALSELGGVETNERAKVEGGYDLAINELVFVESLLDEGVDGSRLCGLVGSRSLGTFATAGGTSGGSALGSLGLGLSGSHGNGDLVLLGVHGDDAHGDLLALRDDVRNVGDEIVRETGDVDEGVGLGADVEEGAVGGDGLDLGRYFLADLEVLQLDAGSAVVLVMLVNSGSTGGAVDVVCLLVGGNTVHGHDFGGDRLLRYCVVAV